MGSKLKKFFKILGPGLITGASDDDPSGIATYSIAGARTGFASLWTALITFPLMVAVQEMCARIALVTGRGLVGTLRTHYPKLVLYSLAVLILSANTINVGADLSGMAAALRLLIPIPEILIAAILAGGIIVVMIYLSYHKFASYLKWLTFILFAYILAAFFAKPDWTEILGQTFWPRITWNKDYLLILVAILGTTISPYLFFWQASEEVEERLEDGRLDRRKKIQYVTKHELKMMKEDVGLGMFFSNLVMYFIIATTAATLFKAGINNIETAQEAAQALRPLAGDASYLLFTIGIVGTGLLAIPVLAGSAAYVASEAFSWQEGLDRPFRKARAFYGVIIFSTLLGFLINLLGIAPMKILFYTAVIYGLISPILILVILHIANNKNVMGTRKNSLLSNILGLITFALMTAAAIGVFLTFS